MTNRDLFWTIQPATPGVEINDQVVKRIKSIFEKEGFLAATVVNNNIDFRDYYIQHINIIGPDKKCFHENKLWASTTIISLIQKISGEYRKNETSMFAKIDWCKDVKAIILSLTGITELDLKENLHDLGIKDGEKILINCTIISKSELVSIASELARWANPGRISTQIMLQLLDIDYDSSLPCDWVDLINMVHSGRSKAAGFGKRAVSFAIIQLSEKLHGNKLLENLAKQVLEG